MEFDVSKDLEINPFRLNEECVSHTGLYFKYSDACADAKLEVSMAKDNLEIVMAERLLAIREQCANKGIKATEATVSAMVACDSEVVKARNKLREVEGVYAKIQVAVNTMETRRSQLDNLVKLAVSNYFASSDTKNVSTQEMGDDIVKREIRKSMNRGKKDD